jgi:TadE-like protein
MRQQLLRRLVQSRDGSVLLETALMITILLMLLFGIVDLGRALYTMNSLTAAAREGARVGAVWQTNPPDLSAVKDTVVSRFPNSFRFGGQALTSAMVYDTLYPVGCPGTGPCSSIAVTIVYPFNWLLPTRIGGVFGTTTLYAARSSLSARAQFHLESQ